MAGQKGVGRTPMFWASSEKFWKLKIGDPENINPGKIKNKILVLGSAQYLFGRGFLWWMYDGGTYRLYPLTVVLGRFFAPMILQTSLDSQ